MTEGKHELGATVEKVEDEVSGLARAVAAKRAAITGLVTVVGSVLVLTHTITPDVPGDVNDWINWAFTGVAFIAGGTWIHRGVTPADPALNPVSSNGVPLVEQPSTGTGATT